MRRHGERSVYHIIGEPEIADILNQPAAGCPFSAGVGAGEAKFRFGRLFAPGPRGGPYEGLVALGAAMNEDQPKLPSAPGTPAPDESNIPSGYTYLGQFIAHEITFDNTQLLAEGLELPPSGRSPSLDLDSLYGPLPPGGEGAKMFDGAELVIGDNTPNNFVLSDMKNDLPRERKVEGGQTRYEAFIGDKRNDDNLPLAQTHLAFMKFHNRVVRHLRKNAPDQTPEQTLFALARRKVIRHFQWIVLEDFLPRVIDRGVLQSVLDGTARGGRLFDVKSAADLFMPVEFSAAAFRFGHSMVRPRYDYNRFHRDNGRNSTGGATLESLFTFTQFSGTLDGRPGLASDWVIDWRHFYDLPDAPPEYEPATYNRAKKIDTRFDLHLDRVTNYPHNVKDEAYRPITVRNLVRGAMLGLPTGQAVAEAVGERPLDPWMITCGEGPAVSAALSANRFHQHTPLWFYILKEAELLGDGNRLGPVGSRIVAETFYGVTLHSAHSIIRQPLTAAEALPRRAPGRFEMADMLTCLDGVVNPNPP